MDVSATTDKYAKGEADRLKEVEWPDLIKKDIKALLPGFSPSMDDTAKSFVLDVAKDNMGLVLSIGEAYEKKRLELNKNSESRRASSRRADICALTLVSSAHS